MAVLSPKVLFYLENSAQIDEWAKLSSKARDELHRWLCSWADKMLEDPPEEDVLLHQALEDTSSPRLLWHRAGWRVDQDEPRIHVGIGIEWQSNHLHRSEGVHAGIWVHRRLGSDGNQALQEHLEAVVRESSFRSGARSKKWWPVRIFLEPLAQVISGGIKGDLDAYEADLVDPVLESYREGALEQARGLWSAFADHVDVAIDKAVR